MRRDANRGGDPLSAPIIDAGLFALAITASLVLARFAKVLALPVLLLGGVLLGPGGLGLLADDRFLDAASDIGLVLLLFYTGLFAHPKALRDGGRMALPLAAYDLVLNFAAAYWIGELFGFDMPSRLLLAGVMATSSTGAILKILTDEGRLLRREGNVLVALLWIEDLAFLGYYFFLSARLGHASDMLTWDALLGLILFLGFLALLVLVRESVWTIPQREILVPLITGIGLLGTYLGTLAALPLVASSFTTGLVMSGTRGARFVQAEAPYLREVGAAVFFFAFGALLDPHLTVSILPLAVAVLGAILLTELLFIPQVARILGLNGVEAHVLGGSLIARGGKSAAFARLAAETTAAPAQASQVLSVSGILTVLLTPVSPLVVRAVLWLRRFERAPGSVRSRDVLSHITRRVLSPGEYAQRNLVPGTERLVLLEWFVLLLLLGVLASLLPFPLRWAPLLAGLLLVPPAYAEARRYFAKIPGTPGTTFETRRTRLPRPDTFLPAMLLCPFLLLLALPLLAPVALLGYPAAALLALGGVVALPRLVHPRARLAPRLRRSLPA